MRAYERLVRYVQVHTASAEDTSVTPTTQRQFDLSRLLAKEMEELGMEGVFVDEHAYTYGFLPATPGMEDKPCIGLIAHLDTIPDFSFCATGLNGLLIIISVGIVVSRGMLIWVS